MPGEEDALSQPAPPDAPREGSIFEADPQEDTEALAAARPEIRQLKKVLELVEKAEKAYKIYPPNSVVLNDFIDRAHLHMTEFLEEFGNIQVTVLPSEFRYRGERVFQAEVRDSSLTFKLYESGLRFLAFFPGIEREEIVAFCDVMKQIRHVDEDEDNVVTLLWEKEVPHITYLVMDREMEGGGADIDHIPDPVGERNEMVKKIALRELSEGIDERQIDPDLLPGDEEAQRTRSVYGLSEEDQEAMKGLLEFEKNYSPVYDFVELLFQIFGMEQSDETYLDMVKILEKILGALATRGDYRLCSSILGELKEFIQKAELSDERREAFEAVIAEIGSPYRIDEAVERLAEVEGEDVEAVFQFLDQMDSSSLPHLCTVITDDHEQEFMKIVNRMAQENPGIVTECLKASQPEVLKTMLRLLSGEAARESIGAVSALLRHPEPTVRAEAAATLGSTGMPKSGNFLMPVLDDPDRQVRKAALKHLVELSGERAFNAVLAKIEDKEFSNQPFHEKRELLAAACQADPDRGVPILRRLLEKKSLFNREKNTETQQCAAMALGELASTEAIDVLQKLSNSKNKVVRDACSLALKKALGREVTRRIH